MSEKERGLTRRGLVLGSAALLAGARAGRAGDPDYTPIWETPSPVTIDQIGNGELTLTLSTTGEIDETYTATLDAEIEVQTNPQDLLPDFPDTITIEVTGDGAGCAQRRGKGRGKGKLRRRRQQTGRMVIKLWATVKGQKTKNPLRVEILPRPGW
jgi:hypothetical protein